MTYFIAEIGNNHNGDIKKCLKLIKSASESGANAVKIQSFTGRDIISPKILSSYYSKWNNMGYKYWYQYLDSIALPMSDHQTAIDYAHYCKIDFITTPVNLKILESLEKLDGINSYKIASMDLSNKELLQSIGTIKKPTILSTGMSQLNEVHSAVNFINKEELSILHCISDYPLEPQNAMLNNLKILKNEFPNYNIGFSDHSLGYELSLISTFLGGSIIEKHFTLNRNDKNAAEHHFSMEPKEFKKMTALINSLHINLEKNEWGRSENEITNAKEISRRSFHYLKNFKKDEIISRDHITFIRPGSGLTYEDIDLIINKKLNRNVYAYQPCYLKDFYL